jgi:hypothetical protein
MRIALRSQSGQKRKTLSDKQTKSTRNGGMAQVVECLPSKCKDLSSIPSIARKKRIKEKCIPYVHVITIPTLTSLSLALFYNRNNLCLSVTMGAV